MTVLRYIFFLFLQKNICCGYSIEAPHQGASIEPTTYVFVENWRKLSKKYH